MKKILLFILVFAAAQLYAQELKPTLTEALLKVIVKDNKGKAEAGQKVTFTSQKDAKQYTGITNAEGKFQMLIPPGLKYKVEYKIFSDTHNDLVLDMPTAEGPFTFEYEMTVTPPRTFRLDNTFFDSGKSTLRSESDKELNELAEYMSLKKTLVIEIGGHTDNVGTAESNQKLSQDRANAVKQYLQKKGISPERVSAKGYGDTKPVADNDTESGKQRNRRTEVHIISE